VTPNPTVTSRDLRVLRVYHSGVVAPWRERDRALARAGIAVTLVSSRHWNEGGHDVNLRPAPGEDVIATGTIGRHPYRFVYDPRPLWRVLRSGPFDVIDIHEEPASLAAAEVILLARLAGQHAPICLYCAQNIQKRYPIPFRWLERIALNRAAAVHTCNDTAGEILRHKGFAGIVENLGLGVDLDRFGPAADRDPSPGPGSSAAVHRFRVGYVGRLEPHKGVAELIDAVASLSDVQLDIVGDGPERVALERQVDRLGCVDRVTFGGFRPADRIAEHYTTFDVLAIPSLDTPGWIEQFGRVAVEAMAGGVPVIASDSGSLAEVVGDAGILVPPGDRVALAAAIDRLSRSETERAALAAQAIRRAEQWSWPAIARRQAALYRQVAA
jgi:glycosyltransferase involved in cell wall biosynthesis